MDKIASGGRKRVTSSPSVDDQAFDQIAKQAECRLAARRQARAEAREIRVRELERQQKEQEENADKVFDLYNADLQNRSMRATSCVNARGPIASPSFNNNNSYHSGRRSSEDSTTMDDSYGHRDVRREMKELEEKFRKAMIQNAQLDNEKSSASYQVELYKDKYQDLEESYSSLNREHKEKCRDLEQLKRLVAKQMEELRFYKTQLEERDRLIEEEGLVIVTIDDSVSAQSDGEENDTSIANANKVTSTSTSKGDFKMSNVRRVLMSSESAQLLQSDGGGSLDWKLKRFESERRRLEEELTNARLELEEERKNGGRGRMMNGSESDDFDVNQLGSSRCEGDYKFRWQKAEQDISTLQANVARLESQVIRYKSAAESSEKLEDELKAEKRKLQRELREAQARVEEVETSNMHLQRRLDKLKNAKSALLKEI